MEHIYATELNYKERPWVKANTRSKKILCNEKKCTVVQVELCRDMQS